MLPRTLSLVALLLASGHAAAADTPTDRGPRASTPVRLPSATGQKLAQPGVRGIAHSVARRWNDELLQAIIRDRPRPTVNARNLYHVSAAMYDAWAAYDTDATPVFRREFGKALDTEAARNEAISHAAYRVCSHRFLTSPGHIASQAAFDTLMSDLGYDINNTSTTGDSPAAIGNRIAASVIAQGFIDSSNEQANFDDNSGYAPVNGPLVVGDPGTGGMNDINHWQPLFNINAVEEQHFLTPHWRDITPFSLTRVAPNVPYANPGPVPLVGGVGDAQMKADLVTMIRWSSQLNPADGVVINISPSVTGNNTLGTEDGTGHPVNPATGLPYDDNLVLQGDFGRVLSEFWADGPHSTTPPGHWNEIANAVSDHPDFEKRLNGTGPVVSDLEWDIKLYLALNGAIHDTAIATWEVKRIYDSSRPISLIREMCDLGQSSDSGLPSYHPNGMLLEPGFVELITEASSAPGERHEHLADHLNEIALYAWAGHPADPDNDIGGAAWILGTAWRPYQQYDFASPPFPGYTSGHSGFSRAAAEVMTLISGDAFFPGGYGEFLASSGPDGFPLRFEAGPSQDVPLRWATYFDASDESGISRIYGGIHPALDDFPGRVLGHNLGPVAYKAAENYWNGLGQTHCPADLAEPFAVIDFADITAFLDAFQTQSPAADTAAPFGQFDFFDVSQFLNNFNAGCP
jgi:hypothetical protein